MYRLNFSEDVLVKEVQQRQIRCKIVRKEARRKLEQTHRRERVNANPNAFSSFKLCWKKGYLCYALLLSRWTRCSLSANGWNYWFLLWQLSIPLAALSMDPPFMFTSTVFLYEPPSQSSYPSLSQAVDLLYGPLTSFPALPHSLPTRHFPWPTQSR